MYDVINSGEIFPLEPSTFEDMIQLPPLRAFEE